MDVGIVARVVAEILQGEWRIVFVNPPEGVNHGGIALQQHLFAQPVGVDAGDQRALVGLGSLRLDERSERNDRNKRRAGCEWFKAIGAICSRASRNLRTITLVRSLAVKR